LNEGYSGSRKGIIDAAQGEPPRRPTDKAARHPRTTTPRKRGPKPTSKTTQPRPNFQWDTITKGARTTPRGRTENWIKQSLGEVAHTGTPRPTTTTPGATSAAQARGLRRPHLTLDALRRQLAGCPAPALPRDHPQLRPGAVLFTSAGTRRTPRPSDLGGWPYTLQAPPGNP